MSFCFPLGAAAGCTGILGSLDVSHANAIFGTHTDLTTRIRTLVVSALAESQGNRGNHPDQQNQTADLNRKDVVGIHGLAKREGVVVIVAAWSLRAGSMP